MLRRKILAVTENMELKTSINSSFASFLKLASAFLLLVIFLNLHLHIYSSPAFLMHSEHCCKLFYSIFFLNRLPEIET